MPQKIAFESIVGGLLRHIQFIKSTILFQDSLSFQQMTQQIVEMLVLLCVRHLLGLYNPNQVADALKLPKVSDLYRSLETLSLYIKVVALFFRQPTHPDAHGGTFVSCSAETSQCLEGYSALLLIQPLSVPLPTTPTLLRKWDQVP